jgi:hypothetical protein
MGYRMLKIDHLYEVYRRVDAGESKMKWAQLSRQNFQPV